MDFHNSDDFYKEFLRILTISMIFHSDGMGSMITLDFTPRMTIERNQNHRMQVVKTKEIPTSELSYRTKNGHETFIS